MKGQLKGFLAGILTMVMAVSLIGTAIAVGRTEQATLHYNGISIVYDGKEVTPTNAQGKKVEPFIINGTTYLPVRGVGSILGLNVGWDASTQTVSLSSVPVDTNGAAPGSVIYDDNGITVTYTGVEKAPSYSKGYYVNLKIVNNSTVPVTLYADDISVDNVMSDYSLLSSDIQVGKIAYDHIWVLGMEEEGVPENFSNVEFKIRIRNAETFNEIDESAILKIKR